MKTELQLLADRIRPLLEGRGFKFKKHSDAITFTKPEPFGFLYFVLIGDTVYAKGQLHAVARCGLGVRHDRIEDIVNQLGHIRYKPDSYDYRKETNTVFRGLQFFPFVAKRDKEQILRNKREKDITKAAKNICTMLEKDGFAFFERYASLEECARDLNEPIGATMHPLCNSFPMRAYYGVAAAALTEPERVPHLIQDYLAFFRDSGRVDGGTMYGIGKGKIGIDGVTERLEAMARLALAARSNI